MASPDYKFKEPAATAIAEKLINEKDKLTTLEQATKNEIEALTTDSTREKTELVSNIMQGMTKQEFLTVLDVFCKKGDPGSRTRKSWSELKEMGGPFLSLIHQEIINRFGGAHLLKKFGTDAQVGDESINAMIALQSKLGYKTDTANTEGKDPDGVLGPITLGLVETEMSKDESYTTKLASEGVKKSVGSLTSEALTSDTTVAEVVIQSIASETILQKVDGIDALKEKWIKGNPQGFDIDPSAEMFRNNIALFGEDKKAIYTNEEFVGNEQTLSDILYNGVILYWGKNNSTHQHETTILTTNHDKKKTITNFGTSSIVTDYVNLLTYTAGKNTESDPERYYTKVNKDGQNYRLNLLPQRDYINNTSVFLGFKVTASKIETKQ